MIALLLFAAAAVCLVLAWRSHRERWQQRMPAWTRRPVPVPPATTRRVRTEVDHLLYVYRWAAGGDAYFGISNEPGRRHDRHTVDPRDAEWFPLTTGVMYEVGWYPNRALAERAEADIIRREALRGALLANTRHNPYPGRWRQHV